MPKNRKIYYTTQELAQMNIDDTIRQQKLDKLANDALKEDKLEPYRKSLSIAQNSVVDTKTSRLNATDMEIRAKLERIGYNSRLTPDDLVERKELTRPEQAEIDVYHNRLRQFGAQANMVDETPPDVEVIPKTEDEWEDLNGMYAKTKKTKQLTKTREQIIEMSARIESIKQRIQHSKNARALGQLRRSLSTCENDLAILNGNFRKVDEAIKETDELRRQYVDVISEQNKELIDEYNERIKSLTTLGLSTARLPMESDDDYVARINDNINAMTLEEQLFDGQLFLIREFLAKMRTLNIPLDVIESLNKHLPDDVKEWVLTAWPLVKKEFISMYGTNPYRINTEYTYDFLMKMHELRDTSKNPSAVRVTTNNIQKVTYLMNKFKSKMESAGISPKIVKLLNDGLPDEVKEWITNNFHIVKQALHSMYGANFSKMTSEGAYDEIMDLYNNKPTDEDVEYNDPHFETVHHTSSPFHGKSPMIKEEGEGFRKLGKKNIHMGKLLKSNKLDVRNDKKGNIYGFPVASVSNLFSSYVNNLTHGKQVSNDEIAKLNTTEQKLFQRLQHVCELKGSYHDSDSLGSMKERLKLVEDEIRSGNDNKHLLVEAKEILTVLARQNVITKGEKDRFYKQLCNVND